MTDNSTELKRCTKCKELKPFSEFYKEKRNNDSPRPWCKECSKKYDRIQYQKNKEQKKEKSKQNYKKNKEERKEYYKKYYKDHKQEKKERSKLYYIKNKDTILEKTTKYGKTEKGKLIYANKNHNRRIQKQKTERYNRITLDQWKKIIESQNNKCAHCGCKFIDEIKPTMDHILPLSKGGEHTSANIQALCQSCNSSKCNSIEYNKIQSWGYL